jgi:hypothetical protein
MPQFQHDDFAKSYLTELLSTIGKAVPNYRIKSEAREADLWFELNPDAQAKRGELGLLGQLLTRNSLIEVFRNPASAAEIRSCEGKLFDREAELIRQAKRRKETLSEESLPDLWLIMPTASEAICKGFGAIPSSTTGLYAFPYFQRTGLIVVHQLPKTADTLWLRILGREGNQRQAIEEFVQQPVSNELRASIEELLTDYRAHLESLGRKLTQEDEELIMNLSAAYIKKQQEWLEKGEQRGIQRGRQEGRQEVAIAALQAGFSTEIIMNLTGLSLEAIETLRKQMGSKA